MSRFISRRSGPLVPRDVGGERQLAAVIAALCFIACLAAVAAPAADRAAHGWAGRLRAEATVQVRPGIDETGAVAAARAAETLAGVAGVDEAQALARDEAETLLRPWLGEAALGDIALPHLVTVRLDPARPASAEALSRALAEAGLDAAVDDHGLWRREVERAALLVSGLAVGVFLLSAAAAATAVAYATRAGMAARRQIIDILSLNGATDRRIAWLFQRRFAVLASISGAAGAIGAAVVLAVFRLGGGDQGFGAVLPLAWSDLLILSPCPLLAATVAVLAARGAALRSLGQRP